MGIEGLRPGGAESRLLAKFQISILEQEIVFSKDVIARAARAQIFEKARGSAERENHARFLVGRAERARAQI